jgi:hypothetical protein
MNNLEEFYLTGTRTYPHREDELVVLVTRGIYRWHHIKSAAADTLGYLPLVGSISGFLRISVIGILYIKMLAKRQVYPSDALIKSNLTRGFVELLPFGGILLYFFDRYGVRKRLKEGLQYIRKEFLFGWPEQFLPKDFEMIRFNEFKKNENQTKNLLDHGAQVIGSCHISTAVDGPFEFTSARR